MVRITIDTEKDSHHTIQKVIALLEQFSSAGASVQTNAQKNSSYEASYKENTPAGSSGFTDLFGSMPTSEPARQTNAYQDLFAANESEQPSAQQNSSPQHSPADFFAMASPKSNDSSSSLPSSSAVSETPRGMFDMFDDDTTSSNNASSVSSSTDAQSLVSSADFPSVFDNYTNDKEKEDFSAKDYLKVQEYDE